MVNSKISWDIFNTIGARVPVDFSLLKELLLSENLAIPNIEWTLLSRRQIQKVNYQFAKKDYPADCLSFPSEISDQPASVLLCPQEIQFYAHYYHLSLQLRWTHLIFHSTLHLCGFDHDSVKDFEKMIAKERSLLEKTSVYQGYYLTDEYFYQRV